MRAASSRSAGSAWMRAVRNRNVNGKYRHVSKAITVSRATGTSTCSPRTDTVAVRCDRNATGSAHPNTSCPIAFTTPNCGLSIVCHTNVTATTGAT